jgi:hypothetical protein
MFKTVILSDEGPVEVRTLGLYELDSVPFNDPGDFEFDYQLSSGQVTKKRYTLRDWTETPEQPTQPRESCEPGSYEWALWNRWDLYSAVLQRRLEQIEAAERHTHDVARYVIRACLAEADRGRVRTPGDLEAVMGAALVEEETIGGIEAALAVTFPGFLGWHFDFAGAGGLAGGRG